MKPRPWRPIPPCRTAQPGDDLVAARLYTLPETKRANGFPDGATVESATGAKANRSDDKAVYWPSCEELAARAVR